jgi:hypothetical protein
LKLAGVAVIEEVLIPAIAARMEQRDVPAFLLVPTVRGVRLVQVAGFAGERQVVQRVIAAGRARENVLDLEREVEDPFRGAAVLTPLPRAFRHGGVEGIHDFTIGSA